MNTDERSILTTFQSLLRKKLTPHAVALFGSRARGASEIDSDMDVLVVVSTRDKHTEDYISDCAWEAAARYGIVLVPVVFSREEWEESPERSSLLAQSIKREGIFL